MSSCPKGCGPQGNVIPTPGPEEPADLAPKAYYSCLKSGAKPDAEEEVEMTKSGKSSEQECEKAEGENTKPEEENEVEEEEAEDKQKRKEIEHSPLFSIADATPDHRMKIVPDAQLQAPITSDLVKLVKLRSLKLSPNKSPRGEPLQQATHDDDRASS